jgi:hypothetical protein
MERAEQRRRGKRRYRSGGRRERDRKGGSSRPISFEVGDRG